MGLNPGGAPGIQTPYPPTDPRKCLSGTKGAIPDLPHRRVWVAVWVQRVCEKLSLCVIILNRAPADSLSANQSAAKWLILRLSENCVVRKNSSHLLLMGSPRCVGRMVA
jgi:hypothetical protein